jgi:cytochrome c-type biogenesis protein CcmF
MDIGIILIWLGLLLCLGTIFFSFLTLFFDMKQFRKYAVLATLACVLVITFAYLLLTYYFLTSNFNIHYVWYNSSENVEWYLKLSGVWAGQEGSLLLWGWLILLSLGIEELIQYRRKRKKMIESELEDEDYDEDEANNNDYIYDWTRAIVMGVALVFLILLVIKNPFEATHMHKITYTNGATGYLNPDDYPGGHGMNPMLRNLWMVIHPPVLFIGYAFITIPFAASMAYAINGDKKWADISIQWSRWAWLFLTLGIGIGGLWAYVALGWGGYWAWDPVEVGSLVPWITLSAFLHTQLMNKRKNQYKFITPILATLTFLLVIFATFITRSGMWESVHAWSETELGQILLITMIGTIVLSSIVILRSFILRKGGESIDDLFDFKPKMSWDKLSMFGSVIVFGLLTLVTFVGLIMTMSKPDIAFYETSLAPAIIILLVAMVVCLGWRHIGKENTAYALGWALLLGIACAVFLPSYLFPGDARDFYGGTINSHHIVGFLIPLSFLVIIAAIIRIAKSIKRKSLRTTLKSISPHIIHIGVALIIISYGASQTMVVEGKERLHEGDTLKIGDYKIQLKEIKVVENTGDLDSNEYWDTWFVTIEIYKDDILVEKGELNIVYSFNFNNQGQRYYSMIMTSEVYVANMAFEDVYINFLGINDNEIELSVKVIPMMQFLWGGMWLFTIGIIIRIAVDYLPSKKKELDEFREERRIPRDRRRKDMRTGLKPKKDKKYYENKLERELKRLRG